MSWVPVLKRATYVLAICSAFGSNLIACDDLESINRLYSQRTFGTVALSPDAARSITVNGGPLVAGTTVYGQLLLRNDLETSTFIEAIKSKCGCVAPDFRSLSLDAHDTVPINIRVVVPRTLNTFHQPLQIVGTTAQLTVNLHCDVISPFAIDINDLVVDHEPRSQGFSLRSQSDRIDCRKLRITMSTAAATELTIEHTSVDQIKASFDVKAASALSEVTAFHAIYIWDESNLIDAIKIPLIVAGRPLIIPPIPQLMMLKNERQCRCVVTGIDPELVASLTQAQFVILRAAAEPLEMAVRLKAKQINVRTVLLEIRFPSNITSLLNNGNLGLLIEDDHKRELLRFPIAVSRTEPVAKRENSK